MNRSVALHNIQITLVSEILLYLINTYSSPSRLFIQGGGEIFVSRRYYERRSFGDAAVLSYQIRVNQQLKNVVTNCETSLVSRRLCWSWKNWHNHLGKEGKSMAVKSTEQKSGYKVPGASV